MTTNFRLNAHEKLKREKTTRDKILRHTQENFGVNFEHFIQQIFNKNWITLVNRIYVGLYTMCTQGMNFELSSLSLFHSGVKFHKFLFQIVKMNTEISLCVYLYILCMDGMVKHSIYIYICDLHQTEWTQVTRVSEQRNGKIVRQYYADRAYVCVSMCGYIMSICQTTITKQQQNV